MTLTPDNIFIHIYNPQIYYRFSKDLFNYFFGITSLFHDFWYIKTVDLLKKSTIRLFMSRCSRNTGCVIICFPDYHRNCFCPYLDGRLWHFLRVINCFSYCFDHYRRFLVRNSHFGLFFGSIVKHLMASLIVLIFFHPVSPKNDKSGATVDSNCVRRILSP